MGPNAFGKGSEMKRPRTGTKRILIALNTMFVIFGLASGFTGTIAWFNATHVNEQTAGSFTVGALPETQFEIYYLDYFLDGHGQRLSDGNQNSTTNVYSGYELSYSRALFTKINYDGEGLVTNIPNPTDITHLWPAHKLTFALYLTAGNFTSFTLKEWSEEEGGTALVGEDSPILLSWAMDIYGGAYRVAKEEGEGTDEEKAFAELTRAHALYYAAEKTDGFTYSEEEPAVKDGEGKCVTPSTIIPSGSLTGTGERIIAFFTIEFSNDSSTFYTRGSESPYYYSQDDYGDSNCYEGLSLSKMEFTIE